MGTILVSEFNAQVAELLQDETNLTWTSTQLVGWLNDALRALIYERPDANIQRRTVRLVPGTEQTLTGAGTRLHEVMRNMGSAGTVPGAAVRLVSRRDKDAFSPDWHSATAATAVKEYLYDPADPLHYEVSPPVDDVTAVYVELSQFETATEVATVDDTITVDDIWVPALLEWVCFRCTERDSENVPQQNRQSTHLQRFYAILGRKTSVDLSVSPQPEKAA